MWEYDLRAQLADVYRGLRAGPAALAPEALIAILRGRGPQPRTGTHAGRLLRVLSELGLIALRTAPLAVTVPAAPARTELERSPAFGAYCERLADGLAQLAESEPAAQPAPAAAAVA
jgi:hypothetical protein